MGFDHKKMMAKAGMTIAACAMAGGGARPATGQQTGVVMMSNSGGQGQAGQSAQAADGALPKFEVASIKKHVDDGSGGMMIRLGGPDVGRYNPTNVNLKLLVEFAYNMKDFQVSGGPGWVNSERFDISAKVEDAMVDELKKLSRDKQQDQMRLMVRSLLAD